MLTTARRTIAAIYGLAFMFIFGAIVVYGMIHAIAQIAPKCENEDQTGFCTWIAQTEGNGQGHSFLVIGDFTLELKF